MNHNISIVEIKQIIDLQHSLCGYYAQKLIALIHIKTQFHMKFYSILDSTSSVKSAHKICAPHPQTDNF